MLWDGVPDMGPLAPGPTMAQHQEPGEETKLPEGTGLSSAVSPGSLTQRNSCPLRHSCGP